MIRCIRLFWSAAPILPFVIEYFFETGIFTLSTFDYEYEGRADQIVSVDVRIGTNSKITMSGIWEHGGEDRAATGLSNTQSSLVFSQLIDGSEEFLYRIEKGDTRRVHLDTNMARVVVEFSKRVFGTSEDDNWLIIGRLIAGDSE